MLMKTILWLRLGLRDLGSGCQGWGSIPLLFALTGTNSSNLAAHTLFIMAFETYPNPSLTLCGGGLVRSSSTHGVSILAGLS